MRTCSLLLAFVFGLTLGACKKEAPLEAKSAPRQPALQAAPTPTPRPSPAPAPKPATSAVAPEATPAPSGGTPVAARAAFPSGEVEAEATVLKVRKLLGGRPGSPPSYEVHVGLADGASFSFLPLQNVLTKNSKVMVRYTVKDGQKTRLVLPVAVPSEGYTISGEVLPLIKPAPVGDGTFSITFPSRPDETKTDLGTLYRYEYKFSSHYFPDTYYFFRTSAEGSANPKFFKEQALSFLALTGGKRAEVRLEGAKTDRRTGLKRASGRLTIEIGYSPKDGVIQLWFDARKKTVYGAWVLAYSPNQLRANEEMRRAFMDSFSLQAGR